MTMVEDRDQNAEDFIRKLVEDGMSEAEAVSVWEQQICPICGMDRVVEFEMLHELHKHYSGEIL